MADTVGHALNNHSPFLFKKQNPYFAQSDSWCHWTMAIPSSCQWLVCSGHVTIFWLYGRCEGSLGKILLLQKNGSSSAFPSLPACTTFPFCLTSEMWYLELWQPHCNLEVRSLEMKPNMNMMSESRHKKSMGPQWCDCAAELSPKLLSFELMLKM